MMLFTSALSFGVLFSFAAASPIQPRDGLKPKAYKDVTQVLDRISESVTRIGRDVERWPGNPRNGNTIPQIIQYVPVILADSSSLLSDLSVGTDWIQRNKKTTLGVLDAVSLVPRLAALNNALAAYTDALVAKKAWADSSSSTPQIYDQLILQKQWAGALSKAITESLGVTTSWLGGPISDFFFGEKLDAAIKGFSDGARYRPGTAPPPPQNSSPPWSQPAQPSSYYPPESQPLPLGPQTWPNSPIPQQGQASPSETSQNPNAQQAPPAAAQGQNPPYEMQPGFDAGVPDEDLKKKVP